MQKNLHDADNEQFPPSLIGIFITFVTVIKVIYSCKVVPERNIDNFVDNPLWLNVINFLNLSKATCVI